MKTVMQQLADEYRNSDKNDPELHCDIFLLPVNEDGGIDSEYIKETLSAVYAEIRRFTGMTLTEAREWFSKQQCETWFGESKIVNEKVYKSFYVRYDIPEDLLKPVFTSDWTQGPSATFEEAI
ncbi:hypothetical protein pp2_041 [Vibrio phage phi-pp2]|uniref:Uncharacterized protein n=1 Tax=Vibrio phage phi-pp2 TaxID=1204514 RepID=I6W6P0_9CAUD|nr:hypothetical protein pp2_041 [Vibrio phage phi-pp2]